MKNITFETNLGKKYSVKTERIIKNGNGFIITRGSSYGAEIFCTKEIMIIDVDYEENIKKEDHILSIIKKCNEFVEENNECNLRLYKTAGGMRILISGPKDIIDIFNGDALDIMDFFHVDWRYSMLCEQQGCFRARLTPKPKRIGLDDIKCFVIKSGSFAGNFVLGEDVIKEKIDEYYQVSKNYKVCDLILSIEYNEYSKDIDDIIKIHDKITKANKNNCEIA